MANLKRVGDLEIEQDLDHQERVWFLQRIAWFVMALATLAGLLGVFGTGVLSNAKAGKQTDPLWVEYERFERFQSQTKLRIHFNPNAERAGEIRVWFKLDYIENVQLQQITPEPKSVEAQSDRLIYTFSHPKPDQPTAVTFYMQPEKIGPLSGSVGLETGSPISFNQLVYP
ncbi:MAG: hypothetical protein PUP91_23580 [Rhizonema sp. PD37]|nr:hypothetical protein [Rhizonema sp. PD37]